MPSETSEEYHYLTLFENRFYLLHRTSLKKGDFFSSLQHILMCVSLDNAMLNSTSLQHLVLKWVVEEKGLFSENKAELFHGGDTAPQSEPQ